MPRRLNWRRIKIHRNYKICEAADVLGVHKNTVRNWIKYEGLPALTDQRPHLILGRLLRDFLIERDRKRKTPLKAGEIYCVACHSPKRPAGAMVDFILRSDTSGVLRGICPDCDRFIHRHASRISLDDVAAGLEVQITRAERTLEGLPGPPVTCDFRR